MLQVFPKVFLVNWAVETAQLRREKQGLPLISIQLKDTFLCLIMCHINEVHWKQKREGNIASRIISKIFTNTYHLPIPCPKIKPPFPPFLAPVCLCTQKT